MTAPSYWRSVHALADAPRPAFHMPGHGHRRPAPGALASALDARVFALDQSEMAGLDYLHEPTGPLAASQARAARVFGADRSWYLVNGATAGNLAALWAVARPGGRVLAMRRSHQSVSAAAALAGLEPVHLPPVRDPGGQGLAGLDLEDLRDALARTPDLVCVHVTSPDYYGLRLPLSEIAALCAAAGVPLVVDEAHGAHLSFVDGEQGALAAGADLVVHSPHKALGSLTQSAVLHLRGGLVDPDRVSEALVLLQSSSPSALLTLSLDAVVEDLERDGRAVWTARAQLARDAVARRGADGRPLLDPRSPLPAGTAGTDPCKLVVDAARYGRTAPQVAQALRAAGVRPEFTDGRRLVLSVTAGTTAEDVETLLAVLSALAAAPGTLPPPAPSAALALWPDRLPVRALPARDALQGRRDVVALEQAGGRVVAAPLTPYPPGIPLVLPGEVLSAALVGTVQALLAAGVVVRGLVPDAAGRPAVRCAAAPHAAVPAPRLPPPPTSEVTGMTPTPPPAGARP